MTRRTPHAHPIEDDLRAAGIASARWDVLLFPIGLLAILLLMVLLAPGPVQ